VTVQCPRPFDQIVRGSGRGGLGTDTVRAYMYGASSHYVSVNDQSSSSALTTKAPCRLIIYDRVHLFFGGAIASVIYKEKGIIKRVPGAT
jgi:hypothetical protein